MKPTTLNTPERMLFALLRASLLERDAETDFFQHAAQEDWRQCYRLAAAQGVMALAWDGVLKLPATLQPPRPVKLSWAAGVEAYERKYLLYCSTVTEISEFYARHNIATLQLKGVGFSSLYPVPSHREGGDIDIFTYSACREKLSDAEANRLADTLMQRQGIEVDTEHSPKHSMFYYKGIPVENHKTFLNVETYALAAVVERLLKEHMNPSLTPLAAGQVHTPSPMFNTLFIAFHAAQHYGSGLALHHLCDWAMILRRYGLQLPEEIKGTSFAEGIGALTRLCNRYLGLSVASEGQEDLAEEMLQEMLHPRYPATLPDRGKWGILLYKAKRLIYNHRLKSRILPVSFARHIGQSVVSHLRHPETIFH